MKKKEFELIRWHTQPVQLGTFNSFGMGGLCKTKRYKVCVPACTIFNECENRPYSTDWILKN
ncbi:uncharacterized protein METZ01_LOCUS329856 [marine metagenome]|uniref:Uncharacterized protein n=1 Tax=marine metagenome TaxID=408172 RepID=A0A382PY41_9ZZZZ